jgi:hypothetical protein
MEAQFKLYADSEELYNPVTRSIKNVEKVCAVLVRCKHIDAEAKRYYAEIAGIDVPEKADLGYAEHHAVLADALFIEKVKPSATLNVEAVYDALSFFFSRFGMTLYEATATSSLLSLIRNLSPAQSKPQ